MAPSTLRRAGLRAGLIVAAACAALAPGLAAQATDSTTTIPVHASQVPTTAAGFDGHSCANIKPGASETLDGWVFVLPGKGGAFQSLTLTFKETDGSTTTVSVPPSGGILTDNGTSKAWVQTPKGWTLTAGTAVITGSSPQGYFNITHTCPATGPKPTPSPSKSHSPSPSPSGPAESASTSPSGSASASASASSPATGSTSASPSTAGAVATSPAANSGTGLPVTGVALTGFVVAGLALVGVGTVLVLARRRRRVAG